MVRNISKLILLLSIFIATPAYTQCGVVNPSFGSHRAKVDSMFTTQYGKPSEVDKHSTKWMHASEPSIVLIYKDEIFYGLMIISIRGLTNQGVTEILGLSSKVEEFTVAEGFVFDKQGTAQKETLSMVYREFICKSDPRVKSRITVGKDPFKGVATLDSLTYYEGEFK